MRIQDNRYLPLLALLGLVPLAGCAGSAVEDDPGRPGSHPGGAKLEVVGPSSRSVAEQSEETIKVRYLTNDGVPIDQELVEFAIEGTAQGATLSAGAGTTDRDGVATVTLRAGMTVGFDVVATALDADPAIIGVDVERTRFGTFDYTVTYAGMRPVRKAEVALFTNTSCDGLTARVPAPADVQQLARLGGAERFMNVEIGRQHAVYALGIDANDLVAAEKCTDITLNGLTGRADIVIVDVAELFGGTYSVEETLDVTEGLPAALDIVLDVLGGLSDDPAAYIVDTVAASSSTPSWLRTALSWGPTRSIAIGVLRAALNELDDSSVYGYVEALADLAGGVNVALEQMTLVGELTFPEPDEFGVGMARHRITTMRVPVDTGTVERAVSATADVQITVGRTITLPEHELNLSFGLLMEAVLNEVLLPRFPGEPSNMGELIGMVLDCDAIASEISGESSTTEDIVNGICDVGLSVLGAYVENALVTLWEYDTLHLSGTANLVDSDADYDRDQIAMGTSLCRWTGDSGELSFPGTMTGTRADDTAGRAHPVRERMRELR